MASLNKVQIIGNLGKDPEMKHTPSGKSVTAFNVAVNSTYNSGGEQRKETEWFNIEAWGKTGEIIKQYASKGSLIYIEGRLKTDKFEDKQSGETKYFTKVVVANFQFLSSNSNGNPRQTEVEASAELPPEDDIPF